MQQVYEASQFSILLASGKYLPNSENAAITVKLLKLLNSPKCL